MRDGAPEPNLPATLDVSEIQHDGPATAARQSASKAPSAVYSDDDEYEQEALEPDKIDEYYQSLGLDRARTSRAVEIAEMFLNGHDIDHRYVEAALSRFRSENLKRGLTGGLMNLREAFNKSRTVRYFTGLSDDEYMSPKEIYDSIMHTYKSQSPNYAALASDLLARKASSSGKKLTYKERKVQIFRHFSQRNIVLDDVSKHLFRQLHTDDVLEWLAENDESTYCIHVCACLADDTVLTAVMKKEGYEHFFSALLETPFDRHGYSIHEASVIKLMSNVTRCLSLVQKSDSYKEINAVLRQLQDSLPDLYQHWKPEGLKNYPNAILATIITTRLNLGQTDMLFRHMTEPYASSSLGSETFLEFMAENKYAGGAAYTLLTTLQNLGRQDIAERLFDQDNLEYATGIKLHLSVLKTMKERGESTSRIVYLIQNYLYRLENRATLDDLAEAEKAREVLYELDIDPESIARPPVAAAEHADEPVEVGRDATERAILQDKEISEKERANRLLEYRARPHITDEAEVAPAASAAAEPAKESALAHLDFEDVPEGRALDWAVSRVLRASFEHSDDNKALYSNLHADLATLLRHNETAAAEYVLYFLHNIYTDLYDRNTRSETLLVHLYWESKTSGDTELAEGVRSILGDRLSQLEDEEAEHYLYIDNEEFSDAEKSGEMTQSIKNEMLRQAERRYKTVAEQRVAKTELDTKVAYFERLIEAYNEPRRELTRLQLLLESERKNPATDERVNRVHHLESEIEAMKEEVEEINEARSDAMAAGSPPAWRAKIAKLQAEFKKIYLTKRLRKLERLWVSRGAMED